ncbi:PH domain-containing protein [soil metagenome]
MTERPVPPPPPPPPPPQAPLAAELELADDHEWQRLDPRMLLVYPIRELLRFLPVLIAILIAGSASGDGPPWRYLGVVIPIGLGVLRYVTTGFRIADGRVELRHGLLSRHVLSTPLDRVRTVDLTASPIHRVVGLTTLRIGTGTGGEDDKLDLDGLPVARAHRLREGLLRITEPERLPGAYGERPDAPPDPPSPPLVSFDLSWLRYAPFTSGGLVVAAAVFGGLSQLLNLFDGWERLGDAHIAIASGLIVAVLLGVVLLIAAVALLAMTGYLVTNWGFRLTHSGGAWHVRRGLLTTRETSIDEDRVAGVCLSEPLLLRAARGRSLSAVVTGIDTGDAGNAALVPPSPEHIAPRVAGAILGTDAPMTVPLHDHGPAARRRRWTRALVPVGLVVAAAILIAVLGGPWWPLGPAGLLLVLAVVVARDRAAGLGHALVDGYVVARSGSLARHRVALAVDDVIGWNFRATYFQRRMGLTTRLATTAGGGGSVTVLDVPEDDALRLAATALPSLVEQFCREPRLSTPSPS